jgi:hypothetical protein
MKLNSCFKIRRLRKATSVSLLVAAALVGALACFVVSARASGPAPDWLRAAASEKLPDYPKDTIAVVLLDDGQTTVKDNGDTETVTRRAYKLLRPQARDDYGFAVVRFDNQTKVSSFKAWTITPDGHEIELKDKDALETSLTTYEVFSDERARVLKFAEANPGSIVGYEVVQKQRPEVFDDDWYFQETVPVHRSRLSLQLPPGWEFSVQWANHPKQEPQASGNQYVWEVMDSPAVELEPEMPPWNSVAAHLYLKYFPRDPSMRSKTTGSWKDIGSWYNGLVVPRRVATPAIKQKVMELTAGQQDPVAKMKVLAEYSQRKIRYAAIEIGIGGHQPHAAGDVLTHGYGDCKDKATLLNTMLQEIGVQSYNVLISPERGVILPEFPALQFGHSISAIRLPDGITDPSLYATVDDPKLGRLLFFDPTNEYVPFGYLPSYEQDSYALVVTQDGGTLLHTPLLPPLTNRLLRTAKLDLSAAGNLAGEVQEVRWGGPAELSREQFLETPPAKRAKVVEDFVGNFLNSFTLTGATVGNLEKYDDNLTLDYKFVVSSYAKTAGNLLIVRPRVIGSKEQFVFNTENGKPRKYPIEFNEATHQDDVFDITLPAGYVVDELPPPAQLQCDYATYKSDVQVADGTLHYKRTYEITSVHVPTQKLDEVRAFFRQVAADERSSAVLRRANP